MKKLTGNKQEVLQAEKIRTKYIANIDGVIEWQIEKRREADIIGHKYFSIGYGYDAENITLYIKKLNELKHSVRNLDTSQWLKIANGHPDLLAPFNVILNAIDMKTKCLKCYTLFIETIFSKNQ